MSQQLETVLVVFGTLFALSLIVSGAIFAVAVTYDIRDRRARRRSQHDAATTPRTVPVIRIDGGDDPVGRVGMSRRYSA